MQPFQQPSSIHSSQEPQQTSALDNASPLPDTHTIHASLSRLSIYDRPTAQLPAQQILSAEQQSSVHTTTTGNEIVTASLLPSTKLNKTMLVRGVMAMLIIVLVGAIYLLWQPTAPATDAAYTSTGQATPNNSSTATVTITATTVGTGTPINTSDSGTASIKAYIVGAVQHPGIYTLDNNARVYQLLQAAGGPLTDADLTTVNLASHVSDGQEVYVSHIGETPPAIANTTTSSTGDTSTGTTTSTNTASGLPVNINTATSTELQKNLHISSSNAQKIVSFRLQHGAYTSIDTLAQVLSATVYKKVKGEVTI